MIKSSVPGNASSPSPSGNWIDRGLITLATAGFVLFALHLLYSAFCAFSWQNFLMMDYGAYTNFLYNLAHGDGFQFLTDHNYLKTHLSFSFLLLTPLVHLWDSPLLLIVVQWLFLMGGCAILWKIMRRGNTPPVLATAILFSFVAYPMTQSVMMSEFHGVSAYFLLVPWLLYTILHQKKWAFLPVLVILGLREDAGLIILPMLLFFAMRDRWKAGYVLAGATALYVGLAITVLYPWITGESLLGVRAAEASSGSILQSFAHPHLGGRAQAIFWLGLPAILLGLILHSGWRPLLIFPSIAFLLNLSSAMHRQHSFDFHYPAATVTALVCAMAVIASSRTISHRKISLATLHRIAATALLLVTLIAHARNGFLPGGGKAERIYARPHAQIFPLLRLAQEIPKDGLLLCNQRLAPFFSLRPEIMVLHYFKPDRHTPEFIVTDLHEIQTPDFAGVVASLESGEFGLFIQKFPFLALKRGHASPESASLLKNIRHHQMVPARMLSQVGDVVELPTHGLIKQWDAREEGNSSLLAYGRAIQLPAGDYIARFDLQVPATTPPPSAGYGALSIHFQNQPESIASLKIIPNPNGSLNKQDLPFTLTEPALVEPRITTGDSPLQARSILLLPEP